MVDTARNAGWYPDPDGRPGERWWNGAGWSDARRGAPAASAPTVPAPPYSGTNPPPPVVYSSTNPPPQSPADLPAYRARAMAATRLNRNATIGFTLGIIAVFANILFVLAPIGLVFSILGLVKARQLAAAGTPGNQMVIAIIGFGLNAFAIVVGIVELIASIKINFS